MRMYNGTLKWCSISQTLCVLLPATLPGDFPTHFHKKKRTIKEGTFFPLINVNNRKPFVKSLPPFHLWVVNFDSFAVLMCGPDKDERFATKAPLCRCSSEAERAHNESFHWWATLLPRPALSTIHTSESPGSLRGSVSLLFPLLTQISTGSLKQNALTAQCGI